MDPQTIAHYRILSKLGEGGMGAVYRATDTKLARDVAIKVLPDAFANDADRLSRFTREAQVLASLNHPNIAAVYGIEERAIVMELVEGPTLADRLAQGVVPLNEALAIARQIAEALEAAHERGIIHRDLKPANVKVTPDGKVKVLDFGLAKLADAADVGEDPASAPTVVRGNSPTLAGMIMGTAGYMSPEQARGQHVDRRADIWAFGVVLFEMLTGRDLFGGGATVTDMLAAVVMRDPDWSLLPDGTPASVRRLLDRCLRKDLKTRLRDIGEACFVLDGPMEAPPVNETAAVADSRRSWLPWALVASLTIVAAIGWWMRPAPRTPPMAKFVIQPPEGVTFGHFPAVSPDGRRIAAVVHQKNVQHAIVLRSLDGLAGQMLAGDEDSRDPFWSPDGRSLAFFAGNPRKLKRMEIGGGPAVTLCETTRSNESLAGAWSREGVIVFSSAEGLYQVAAAGGVPAKLPGSPGLARAYPQFLPDGKHYLFQGVEKGKSGVWVGSLTSPEATRLVDSSSHGVFAPSSEGSTTGYLLYGRERTLMAHAFDAGSRQLQGAPFPVGENVNQQLGSLLFGAAGANVLVFQSGSGDRANELLSFDRSGRAEPAAEPGSYSEIVLSPDGKRAALGEGNIQNMEGRELWLLDLGRNVRTRFTFHPGTDTHPVWSPDSTKIVYGAQREGAVDLYLKSSSGGGAEEALLKSKTRKLPTDWSRDGRFLLYEDVDDKTARDIWVLPMAGERKPHLYLRTEFQEGHAKFSPDGNYVAYQSNEGGPHQIYVRPFPDSPKGKWQVSTGGGAQPVWSQDGKELYFISPLKQLMAATVKLGPPSAPAAQVDTPQPLFDSRMFGTVYGTSPRYAHLPDGRFLVVAYSERDASPLTVVLNWK